MNLTYDDDDKIYNAEKNCDDHLKVAHAFAEAKNIASDRGRLGELGSIFSKLVDLKNKLTPSFVKSNKLAANLLAPVESLLYHSEQNMVIPAAGKYGNIIAPVASFFGPWGKLVAVGVTLARQDYVETQNKAKDLQAARANGTQLLDQYKKIAGTVPGRVIGTDTLKDILRAGILNNEWLPVDSKYAGTSSANSPAVNGFWVDVTNGVNNGLARGAVSAYDIFKNEWPDTFAMNKDQQWMIPRDQYQAQLQLDAIDDAMAKANPNLPFSYGTTDAAAADPAAQVKANATWYVAAAQNSMVKFNGTRQIRYGVNGKFITKTMTANNGGVMCTDDVFGDPAVGSVKACYLLSSEDAPGTTAATTNASTQSVGNQLVQPIATPSTPAPVAAVNNTVPLTSDQQTMMQQLLNQLAAQGASQQQMNTALISALSSSGVNTTAPAVQQAVAADVAATHAATAAGTVIPTTAGLNLPSWVGWALLAGTVIFALSRPEKGNVSRETSRRSRRKR